MVTRPQETFNDIVNAGTAHISDFARERLLMKTEMDSDGAFTSSFHDDNAVRDSGKKRSREDDAYQQMTLQVAIDANSTVHEFLYDVLDFAVDKLDEAKEELNQAQEQDTEMKAALTADTDESVSSNEFKEQLENAPAGDYELAQPEIDMLQTALDKPYLQVSDEETQAMQRALESGVITEADMTLVTGGVEAYSQMEAMEAFASMEAVVTTDYEVIQAQRDVQSWEEFQQYLASDDVQQQLENGEITKEDIVAQMPQNVRDAYEAEHGPIESEPSEEMVMSEGTRATAGADSYMEADPELASMKENAPQMANHFEAAGQGIAPTPENAPSPAGEPAATKQGPTPEETATHRATLGNMSL